MPSQALSQALSRLAGTTDQAFAAAMPSKGFSLRSNWNRCQGPEFDCLVRCMRERDRLSGNTALQYSGNPLAEIFSAEPWKGLPYPCHLLGWFILRDWRNLDAFAEYGAADPDKVLDTPPGQEFAYEFNYLLNWALEESSPEQKELVAAYAACALCAGLLPGSKCGGPGLMFEYALQKAAAAAGHEPAALLEKALAPFPECASRWLRGYATSVWGPEASRRQNPEVSFALAKRRLSMLSLAAPEEAKPDVCKTLCELGQTDALLALGQTAKKVLAEPCGPEHAGTVPGRTWAEALYLKAGYRTDWQKSFDALSALAEGLGLPLACAISGLEDGSAFFRLAQTPGSRLWMPWLKAGLALDPALFEKSAAENPLSHPAFSCDTPDAARALKAAGFIGAEALPGQIEPWTAALDVWQREAKGAAEKLGDAQIALNPSQVLGHCALDSLKCLAAAGILPSDAPDAEGDCILSKLIQAKCLDAAAVLAQALAPESPAFSSKNKKGKTAMSYAAGMISVAKEPRGLQKLSDLCKALADKNARLPDPKAFGALVIRNARLMRSNPELVAALESYAIVGKENKANAMLPDAGAKAPPKAKSL